MLFEPRYSPLLGKSDSSQSSEKDFPEEFEPQFATPKSSRLHWVAHAISIFTIAGLIIALARSSEQSLTKCWNMYNYYSPVNEALASKPYVETRFNGSLEWESPFKGPPTPEVEAAWRSIMEYGIIRVDESVLTRLGRSLSTAVQFPAEAGGGYMVTNVGTHQLHCLHYLWQDHHLSYFPDTQRKQRDNPAMYEQHYEHCTDYIRQSLMCHFDTGLVTYEWVLKHQNPTPNANALHKCVNWDAVQGWLKERVVQMPDGFKWKQPDGQESLPWNP